MKNYLDRIFEYDNIESVSFLDEISLWSAPFGLKLLDIIKYRKNINALDIGCGTGFPLLELAQRLGNTCHVSGVDPWETALAVVEKKKNFYGITNVKTFNKRAESLPFEDNYFDLLVSNNGFNNVQDLQQVLNECRRVCKTNAQIVITYNLPDSMKEFYDVFISVLESLNLYTEINKVYSHIDHKRKPLEYMNDIISRNGFNITQVITDSFTYKFSDGSTMLNYFFIVMFFMDSWKSLLPENRIEQVFEIIESRLNSIAEKQDGFQLTIPFACIEAYKK